MVCILGEDMMGGALLAAGKGMVWCVGFPCSHQISPFHYQLSHNNACTRILLDTTIYSINWLQNNSLRSSHTKSYSAEFNFKMYSL